jgi:hypothetical protein
MFEYFEDNVIFTDSTISERIEDLSFEIENEIDSNL